MNVIIKLASSAIKRRKDDEQIMKIVGRDIYLIRGDSASLLIRLQEKNGAPHPLAEGDTIYFTVKQTATDMEKVLQKVIKEFTEEGVAEINFLPTDTKNLDFGQYKYDIQWNRVDGSVQTLVPVSKFWLMEEITYE